MTIGMIVIGFGIMLVGTVVWRFKLINILSNVDTDHIDLTKRDALARYAGCFLLVVGGVFAVLGRLLGLIKTERAILLLLACVIPLIMIACVFYLAGLGCYMQK